MKKILPPSFWRHAGAVMLSLASGPQHWMEMLEQEVLRAAAHKPRHDNYSAIAVWTTP